MAKAFKSHCGLVDFSTLEQRISSSLRVTFSGDGLQNRMQQKKAKQFSLYVFYAIRDIDLVPPELHGLDVRSE